MLAEATGYDVSVGNDASLGAMVEHIFGAGRGLHDLVYLNGGPSGIGGGVIANGALLGGTSGYAGEFGHTRGIGGAEHGDASPTLESRVNRSDLLAALGITAASADELETLLIESTGPTVVDARAPPARVPGGGAGRLGQHPEPAADRARRVPRRSCRRTPTISQSARRRADSLVGVVEASRRSRGPALGSDLLMIGAAELTFAALLADPTGYGRAADATP